MSDEDKYCCGEFEELFEANYIVDRDITNGIEAALWNQDRKSAFVARFQFCPFCGGRL